MLSSRAPTVEGPLLTEVRRLASEPGTETSLPRHRHALSREQVEITQRARIVLATAQVVTTKSYAATSSRDIVRAAGVSSKTFYACYDGKEAAFLAAFTLLDDVMLALAKAPLRLSQPRTDLRAHVQAWLQQLADWPLFARVRLVEGRAAGPRADALRAEMARSVVAAFGRGLDQACASDTRIARPSEGVLAVLYGGITEAATQWIIDCGAERLPELVPAVVEAIERTCFLTAPPYAEGE